jgi:hypothetical protein
MIPDAGGVLSRANQLRNVEESLGIKKENRHLTSNGRFQAKSTYASEEVPIADDT